MEPGKGQHEKVVKAPEGRRSTLRDDLKANGIDTNDEMHIEEMKADQ
jgi:hypothetical protein